MNEGLLESWFSSGITGDSRYMECGKVRVRWVVADALREVAKKEERSMASRLRILAGRIESGTHPTKRMLGKIGSKRLDSAYREFRRLVEEKMNQGLNP